MLEKQEIEYEKVVLIGLITKLQDEEKSQEYLNELEYNDFFMDKKILILIIIGLILISGAAGFAIAQSQSEEVTGLTFISSNQSKFCVAIEDKGVLVVSPGAC